MERSIITHPCWECLLLRALVGIVRMCSWSWKGRKRGKTEGRKTYELNVQSFDLEHSFMFSVSSKLQTGSEASRIKLFKELQMTSFFSLLYSCSNVYFMHVSSSTWKNTNSPGTFLWLQLFLSIHVSIIQWKIPRLPLCRLGKQNGCNQSSGCFTHNPLCLSLCSFFIKGALITWSSAGNRSGRWEASVERIEKTHL